MQEEDHWSEWGWQVGKWAAKKVNVEPVSIVQCEALSMSLQDPNNLTAETSSVVETRIACTRPWFRPMYRQPHQA